MKKAVLFVVLSLMITTVLSAQKGECKSYRDGLSSKTGQHQTSGYRNDGSSHSGSRCGTDFSTKGLSDRQARSEARNLSKGGNFCQYEKVDRQANKQTDHQYQNGTYIRSRSGNIKKGVTGSHIHCQKPKK